MTDPTDQEDFVPLPDLNDGLGDDYHCRGDSSLWDTDNDILAEDLVPDNTPFYPNQLDDPVVRNLFDNDWYNWDSLQWNLLSFNCGLCTNSSKLDILSHGNKKQRIHLQTDLCILCLLMFSISDIKCSDIC